MGIVKNQTNSEIFTTYKPSRSKTAYSENKAMVKKLLRKEAAQEIINQMQGMPKAGQFFEVLTNGQSNAGGFYEVIRDSWNVVHELNLATWIINKDYIDMLFDDLDSGKLLQLNFVISNRMSQLGKGHGPNFNILKTKAMESPKCGFRVANSHAKVFSCNNGTDFITVAGSGNWSENPRIENYSISNDKTRHDFHRDWILELINSK